MSRAARALTAVNPTVKYDAQNEAKFRQAVAGADAQNLKIGEDVRGARLILQSPNGASWSIAVSNSGALSAVAL